MSLTPSTAAREFSLIREGENEKQRMIWHQEESVPGEAGGRGGKKGMVTSHSFAYPKHRQYESKFTIVLSKPPATGFKKEKKKEKKSVTHFKVQKQHVWSELPFPVLAWIIKSPLCSDPASPRQVLKYHNSWPAEWMQKGCSNKLEHHF